MVPHYPAGAIGRHPNLRALTPPRGGISQSNVPDQKQTGISSPMLETTSAERPIVT